MDHGLQEISFSIESDAWLREENSYMTIPANLKSSFPDDCFIPRGTGKANAARLHDSGISLVYQGDSEPIQCFMEVRASGNFRPSSRGHIRGFYARTSPVPGDTIVFRQTSTRTYAVSLLKRGS